MKREGITKQNLDRATNAWKRATLLYPRQQSMLSPQTNVGATAEIEHKIWVTATD